MSLLVVRQRRKKRPQSVVGDHKAAFFFAACLHDGEPLLPYFGDSSCPQHYSTPTVFRSARDVVPYSGKSIRDRRPSRTRQHGMSEGERHRLRLRLLCVAGFVSGSQIRSSGHDFSTLRIMLVLPDRPQRPHAILKACFGVGLYRVHLCRGCASGFMLCHCRFISGVI